MRALLAYAVLACVASCTRTIYAYPPGLPANPGAFELVWHGCYGMHADSIMPIVRLIEDESLNCNGGRGFLVGSTEKACVSGWTIGAISYIAKPAWLPLSQTAFAYEVRRHARGGTPSEADQAPDVIACNAMLAEAGW